MGLPATLAHELAHFCVALVTGSSLGFPSIWPHKENNHWVLGSVAFTPRWTTAGAIALAPLWCLGPIVYLLVTEPAVSYGAQVGRGLLAGYLATAAMPSSQDWWIAAKYPASALVVLALGWAFISTL